MVKTLVKTLEAKYIGGGSDQAHAPRSKIRRSPSTSNMFVAWAQNFRAQDYFVRPTSISSMVKRYVREKEAAAELKLLFSLARGNIDILYDMSKPSYSTPVGCTFI